MSRASSVVVAVVVGFLVPVAVILLAWTLAFDSSECTGDECALELAAVVTGALITGVAVGATCGFVTHVVTARRRRRV